MQCPQRYTTITRLYEQRLEIGKTPSHGKSVRLVYNSAYGKFAQRLESKIQQTLSTLLSSIADVEL